MYLQGSIGTCREQLPFYIFYKILCGVYALQSLKDNNLYIGISVNPRKRLQEHNLGMTKSTKSRKPFKIIFQEKYQNRIKAREKEKYFKSDCDREFLKKLIIKTPL